jgi:uncharacterized protein (TIGR03437 family)
MRLARYLALFLCLASQIRPATFGTVVAAGASYSDIVLDEARSRLYLVNSNTSRIDVYGIKQKAFQTSITTDTQPLSAAMSADGRFLYVAAYAGSLLDVVDLNSGQITVRVSLPANPEGVAVGGDGRVLISTVSVNASTNTLWIYDPTQTSGAQNNLTAVPVAPPAPTPPVLPTPTGRVFAANKSALIATRDGKYIIGANGTSTVTTSTTAKVVFVYEVASGTVLRSRSVANLSQILSVSPDGSRFMSGYTLFDTQTLQIIAQENAANSPFAFPTGTAGNFNTQTNQGGSVFSPDGSILFAAFNMAPVGSTSTHTVELLLNDPDNLLINVGIQLPENLVGKMVVEAAGGNIYALSDSGFTILPVSTIANLPIAQPTSQVVLLTSDQCLVFSAQNAAADVLNNAGKGRFTASIQSYTATTTALGGAGGAGGGVVITLPGSGGIVLPTLPTTPTTTTGAGPLASVTNTASGATLNFKFNSAATVNPGTVGPSDFLILSPEAINIPGNVHVYQNNRSSESVGQIFPVPLNAAPGEGLTDILLDSARQRLYITNSGMNRIEVFDLNQQGFLAPIKVGQLPHGMAASTDGVTLYVANTGGESISIVDLTKGTQTGRVVFPAVPANVGFALSTPQTIAAGARGPQFVMSDGSLWKVDSGQAIPRPLNPSVFGTAARTISGGNPAFWAMAASPAGDHILLMTGSGNAYLYNDIDDDFTLNKQVLSAPLTGYTGPVTAGPLGNYFSVGGTLLNASLTAVAGGTTGSTAAGRPVAAVAAVSANLVAEFTQPVRATATATVADTGMIELYNPSTGAQAGSAPTLEGAPSVLTGNSRVSTFARTLAVDAGGLNAYALTASGLSVIPLSSNAAANAQNRPAIFTGGIVSLGDYTPSIAAGGLMTIFGKNLGTSAAASTSPLPTSLGGTCVTLNNQPLPLTYVTAGQINAEIPNTLAAGRYPLVIHSIANTIASTSSTLTVAKYAPAVLIGDGGQAAVLHSDGSFVTKDNPADRDQRLMIFATGLGPTHGGTVVSGKDSPSSPLAAICDNTTACAKSVQVFFGPPGDTRSPVIVEWSGLTPGLIGVNQINVYVPGTHISGAAVPVTLKIGGVSSASTGPAPPHISVN